MYFSMQQMTKMFLNSSLHLRKCGSMRRSFFFFLLGGIRKGDPHFMRRGPQLIELPKKIIGNEFDTKM
jgi:hypothetical protein